jgi:hypothetical protein
MKTEKLGTKLPFARRADLESWFLLDFVSSTATPVTWTMGNSNLRALKFLRAARVVRVLRLMKLARLAKLARIARLGDIFTMPAQYFMLVKFSTMMLFLLHWVAWCVDGVNLMSATSHTDNSNKVAWCAQRLVLARSD